MYRCELHPQQLARDPQFVTYRRSNWHILGRTSHPPWLATESLTSQRWKDVFTVSWSRLVLDGWHRATGISNTTAILIILIAICTTKKMMMLMGIVLQIACHSYCSS